MRLERQAELQDTEAEQDDAYGTDQVIQAVEGEAGKAEALPHPVKQPVIAVGNVEGPSTTR